MQESNSGSFCFWTHSMKLSFLTPSARFCNRHLKKKNITLYYNVRDYVIHSIIVNIFPANFKFSSQQNIVEVYTAIHAFYCQLLKHLNIQKQKHLYIPHFIFLGSYTGIPTILIYSLTIKHEKKESGNKQRMLRKLPEAYLSNQIHSSLKQLLL